MVETLATLIAGLCSIVAISGIGRPLIRPFRQLPLHWYVSLSMLAGLVTCSAFVQVIAMAGPTILSFYGAATLLTAVGIAGHLTGPRYWVSSPRPNLTPVRTAAFAILIVTFVILMLISIAPSTKIDELYYHMLIGRRVLEDGGLRIYQLPFEQAILPQMGYQIFESLFHAVGAADGGNVLSLAFFATLVFLIYGVVTEQSGSSNAGLIGAVAVSAAVFPAVWDVTAGPHALGDLGTFMACAALVFPGRLMAAPSAEGSQPRQPVYRRAFVCILGAACAASTKIALVPVCLLISAAAIYQVKSGNRLQVALIAGAVWAVVLGPLVAWTYAQTHSPFGLAFSEWFAGSTYQPVALDQLFATRAASQEENPIPGAVEMLNGPSIALMLFGTIVCAREYKTRGILLGLLTVQIVLIAMFLPYSFRFLGGLQYVLLAAGAISLASRWQLSPKSMALALVAVGPWLFLQIYYALPFAMVSSGLTSRPAFKERYIAFYQDFKILDQRLPKNAVLYVPNERPPAVYAPRPMIFDLADWDGRSPVFKFKVGDYEELPVAVARQRSLRLVCREVVYANSEATVQAYRTPGRANERAPLFVRRCAVSGV